MMFVNNTIIQEGVYKDNYEQESDNTFPWHLNPAVSIGRILTLKLSFANYKQAQC